MKYPVSHLAHKLMLVSSAKSKSMPDDLFIINADSPPAIPPIPVIVATAILGTYHL